MSSKPIRDKMAALSISENPLGNQLFKICEGFSKSQPQQTETKETKGEILPVFTPPTQLNVQKYATSEKLWAGLFYRFYYTYNRFNIFIQDDADTGMNVVWNFGRKPKSGSNSAKKKPLSKFTSKTSNTYNVTVYTLNLQKLGEYLSGYNLNHDSVQVQPRGLVNRNTRCYVNATLQALLMCPPFYNLMGSMNLTDIVNSRKRLKSRIPVMESTVKFIDEFEFEDYTLVDTQETLNPGVAFDPYFVYKILPNFEDGYQEDAEEFMSQLLNCINDEMTEIIQLSKTKNDKKLTEIQWKTVTRRCIMKTRITVMKKTPLSKIFRGSIRTRTVLNDDELTDNIEPFFTLKLDIENVKSVKEAMHMFNAKTTLEGLTCSTDKSEVDAYQQLKIDQLPYVLILHIKCFEYKDKKLTKILKDFQFDVDLKIEPKLLSKKSKKNMKKKNYKLSAVVYHEGKEATNGHYYADVFYANLGRWLRFDDSTVRYVTDAEVFRPKHLTMPYLLYYINVHPTEASSATGNPTDR